MKPLLARLISALTANRFSQLCLLKGAWFADYLMGVGAGANVDTSGEASVLGRLKDAPGKGELVVFDVGSNLGQFLQMSAKALAGRAYRMHCFEPGTAAYSSLLRNAEGIENITLNNTALGRETGERLLFMDKPGSRLASLTKRRMDHFGKDFAETEAVLVDTLDNYCSLHGVEHIDLLKLDAEGHELDILAGGAEMLRKNAIRFVLFEFGGCNIDTRTFVQDFYYLFRYHNMRIARITPGGFWFELGNYREIYEQFRTTRFVAYPTGSSDGPAWHEIREPAHLSEGQR